MFPGQPELSVSSAVGLLLVALVVNLVTVLLVVGLMNRYASRSSRSSSGPGGDAPTTGGRPATVVERPDRSSVTCPECEAENDPDYRYCRACVARLPGRANPTREDVPSFGRFAD